MSRSHGATVGRPVSGLGESSGETNRVGQLEQNPRSVAELAVSRMLRRGMCAAFTLNNPRVIRLEPPIIISEDEVRVAVEILDAVLTETSELLAMLA